MSELVEAEKTVSSCCFAEVRLHIEVSGKVATYPGIGKETWDCTACGELCELTWPPCPDGICDGSGITVINSGYCGGCERCGSLEETEVACPHTL